MVVPAIVAGCARDKRHTTSLCGWTIRTTRFRILSDLIDGPALKHCWHGQLPSVRPGEGELQRAEVWGDGLWRLTMSLIAPVTGFAYLEPRRHIPYITDLDGSEAETLGSTLARVTSVIGQERAHLVYVNVFGERVAHLHFNIAPHRLGDPLRGGPGMVREGRSQYPRLISARSWAVWGSDSRDGRAPGQRSDVEGCRALRAPRNRDRSACRAIATPRCGVS